MPFKDPETERAYRRAYYERNREKLRQSRAANPRSEKKRASARAYYERNRETILEKQRASFAKYYAANREKRLENARKWRAANKEHMRAYREKRWAEEPRFREMYGEYRARRRAREKGAPQVEKIDRFFIYERDNKTCQICGKPVAFAELELDHIVPLSKGGEHTHENLRATHMVCNRSRPRGPYR